MDTRPLNGLALCSGIGGLELGLDLALARYATVCHVERDAYAQAVLVARMEEAAVGQAAIWDDLESFDGRAWRGVVDLISSGLPCQPYSLAGKQRGDEDERALWPEFIRIVGEVRPSVVFIENTPKFLAWFRPLGEELSRMGFEYQAGLFSAEELGSPQLRERVFILGVSDTGRDILRIEPWRCGGTSGPGAAEPGNVGEPVDLADSGRLARQPARWPEPEVRFHSDGQDPAMARADCARRATAGERCDLDTGDESQEGRGESGRERLHWPPSPNGDWTDVEPELHPAIEPGVRGMVDGFPDRLDRLRCLGNAVVPVVAAHAFRTLAQEMI